jgi:hypothetical protein
MTRTTGLVLMTYLPRRVGDVKTFTAIVHKRGLIDTRTMRPLNFPGCLEILSEDELKPGEDFDEALLRIMPKRLGQKFADHYNCGHYGQVVHEVHTEKNEMVIFGAYIGAELLNLIQLPAGSGGLFPIQEGQMMSGYITPIPEICGKLREDGPRFDLNFMSGSHIKAVEKAFAFYKIQEDDE